MLGVNIGFRYKGSYFIPNNYVNALGKNNENVLRLTVSHRDQGALRASTQEFCVVYFDEGSKRLCFRSLKLIAKIVTLAMQTQRLHSVQPDELYKIVAEFAELFGMPLNGLTAFQKIKDMILNDILKDIKLDPSKIEMKVHDIEKGSEYSKIREYDVRTRRVHYATN